MISRRDALKGLFGLAAALPFGFGLRRKPMPSLPIAVPTTIKDGDWNDPSTWLNGHIPQTDESAIINHAVRLTGGLISGHIFNKFPIIEVHPGGYLEFIYNILAGKLDPKPDSRNVIWSNTSGMSVGGVSRFNYLEHTEWDGLTEQVRRGARA